jgi:predicted permease
MGTLGRDLRFAVRGLWKSPTFIAVAVLSLAVGLGATTALYSLVDALLLRPLPVAEPDRLVFIQRVATSSGKPMPLDRVALDTLASARAQLAGVTATVGLFRPTVTVNGVDEPDRLVMHATANFFEVLGVRPAAGRLDAGGSDAVAVISARFWRARFHSSADSVGTPIVVNGQSYTIAGVTPPRFLGLSLDSSVDVWLVSPALPGAATSALARLQPGVTLPQATAAVTATLEALDPAQDRAAVGPLATEVAPAGRGVSSLRDQYRASLIALLALVALVLIVTCANLGNLLVVRNVRRRHELAVRRALGAGRSRIIAQLLVESGVLAVLGGVAAWFVAGWIVAAILVRLPLDAIPGQLELALDLRLAAFMAATSLACAALFAILPAWRATRVDPAPALKGAATSTSRDGRRLGLWLVAGQVALSVILVAAAGLFLQTLRNMTRVDLGFDAASLLEVELDRRVRIPPRDVPAMSARLVEVVSQVPGVASVTLGNPLFAEWTRGIPQPAEYSGGPIGLRYFETLGIPLVRGRLFTEDDARRAVGVSVVNESYAREFYPGQDPLGKPGGYNHLEIVGVVADVKADNLRWRNQSIAYRLSLNEGRLLPAILIRTHVAPASLAGAVRAAVASVHPRLVDSVHTVEQTIAASMPRERLVAFTGGAFGLLGLVLAGIGLFGVAALAVAQRTREIAIQRALGASGWNVVGATLRDAAVVLAAGLIAGSLAASIGAQIGRHQISGLLFGLEATDWVNLVGANALLIAVALAACLVPALRATHVDPLTAIRQE